MRLYLQAKGLLFTKVLVLTSTWQRLNHLVDDGADLLYMAFHHISFLKEKNVNAELIFTSVKIVANC